MILRARQVRSHSATTPNFIVFPAGFEPTTSALWGHCSTTELREQRGPREIWTPVLAFAEPSLATRASDQISGTVSYCTSLGYNSFYFFIRLYLTAILSGKRGSNSPPPAWKAGILPNELLPQLGFFSWVSLHPTLLSQEVCLIR